MDNIENALVDVLESEIFLVELKKRSLLMNI